MIYISGQTALNIPGELGKFVGWHLLEAFSGSPTEWQARCTWAGEIDRTRPGRHLPDTHPWLGEAGVWDCTEVLRRHGVEIDPDQRIHAAQPWRAVLDMVLAHATKGRVARHVRLSEWFDPTDDAEQLDTLRAAVDTQLSHQPHTIPAPMKTLLHQWRALQADVWQGVDLLEFT